MILRNLISYTHLRHWRLLLSSQNQKIECPMTSRKKLDSSSHRFVLVSKSKRVKKIWKVNWFVFYSFIYLYIPDQRSIWSIRFFSSLHHHRRISFTNLIVKKKIFCLDLFLVFIYFYPRSKVNLIEQMFFSNLHHHRRINFDC